ncbi:MAG: murein biosynthesis integral membrane protein MurJ [Actinobacteria bacterium]|nr:murein biosynthesis integral membrane protein MurJ [Actinomycetota bacterium]
MENIKDDSSWEPNRKKTKKGLKPASFARGTSLMTLGTAISRVTGFGRMAALALVLGMTAEGLADAFNLANITPNIVYDLLIGGVLASLFIPVFVEYLSNKSEEEAWHVANSVFNITLILLTVVAIGLCIAAPYVIKAQTFLASGRAQMESDATFLLRFFIFEIVFYGFCAIYSGILNSYKHFTIPAFAPIANNIVVIATVALYYSFRNIYILAIGATLGVVCMSMIQYPWVHRTGFRYKPVFDLKHPAVRKIGRLAIPVLAYVVINQVGLWVVNILAAQVQGGISAYQYAYIFFQLPYGIVAVSIITVLFPTLSEHSAKADTGEIVQSVSLGVRTTAFIVIPASVGYAILATPIVRLLLEHLNFNSRDTQMLASVLFYFVLGLFFFSIFMLVLKVFYSMQDTKTPMIIAALIIGLNIGVDFLYFYLFQSDIMKVSGLALGNTTAYVIGSVCVAIVLRRRLGRIDGRKILESLVKITIASGIMGIVCWGSSWLVEKTIGVGSFGGQLLQVLGAIAAGAAVYVVAAMALKSEEMDALKRLLGKVFKRGAGSKP